MLVLGPLAVFQRKGLQTAGRWGFVLFFLRIGLGFIPVEISFVQKLVLFLGYPTYSLTVVLFSLPLFSGIGSYATSRMSSGPARRSRRGSSWWGSSTRCCSRPCCRPSSASR